MPNGGTALRVDVMKWIVALAVAAAVSYFTTIGSMRLEVETKAGELNAKLEERSGALAVQIEGLKSTGNARFDEVQRSLMRIEVELARTRESLERERRR